MSSMTDERRREMEDEMSRFEQEIASTGADGVRYGDDGRRKRKRHEMSEGGSGSRFAPPQRPPMHPGMQGNMMPPMMPFPRPMPMGHGFMGMDPPPPGYMGMGPPRNFGPPGPPMFMGPSHSSGPVGPQLPPEPLGPSPAVYSAAPVKTYVKEEVVLPPPVEIRPPVHIPEPEVFKERIVPMPPRPQPTISAYEDSSKKKEQRRKRCVRIAGGQTWEDNSLLDWDPDDFRIFCGDLGNDVTDEVLTRAFGKFPSFVKAKIIRDKRTNKTKGYGFVSFRDPQDFIQAMKEMNGKYVGSRPIKLRKSNWKERNIEISRKKQKEKEKLGLI